VTEAEWLASTDPERMIEFLRGNTDRRKLNLFIAACCRRLWPFFQSQCSREVVRVVEEVADGLASHAELESACRAAQQFAESPEGRLTESGCCAAWAAAFAASRYASELRSDASYRVASGALNTRYWVTYEMVESRGSDDQRAAVEARFKALRLPQERSERARQAGKSGGRGAASESDR
jgi:hypothetical protein